MKNSLIAAALLWATSVQAGDLPDPKLTPGATMTTDKAAICGQSTKTVRNVPESLKEAVYRSYGMKDHISGQCASPQGCEVDHLVSLELGGSNAQSNLWPQAYGGTIWNAHIKDKLENHLHKLVCTGQLDVMTAQSAIAKNWIAAYRLYIGPVPTP